MELVLFNLACNKWAPLCAVPAVSVSNLSIVSIHRVSIRLITEQGERHVLCVFAQDPYLIVTNLARAAAHAPSDGS